jgi:hypothetical protein
VLVKVGRQLGIQHQGHRKVCSVVLN